jgi:branched-chain amino acid transport system permease protein
MSGESDTVTAHADGREPGEARPNQALLTLLLRSRTLTGPMVGIVVLVILVVVLMGSGFWSALVVNMLVYAIAAMSLDFLGGYAGLISLGQAGFLGLGAYGVAIAEVHNYSPLEAVGISVGVVLGLGLALGIVAVRVKGISFVIITLAIGQILWGLAFQWVKLSEGDNGITLPNLPKLGPVDLNDPLTLRMTVLVVFLISALLLTIFVRSPFGLSLRGVRSNERRLASLGYRTGLHRYIAWVIAVLFAGIAGILYVFTNSLISPSTMDFTANGFLVLMAVLGGLGSIWGPAIGAAVIVFFQQEVSIHFSRWQTLMGLALIAVVVFSPSGIWGFVRSVARRRDALIARLRAGAADALAAQAARSEQGEQVTISDVRVRKLPPDEAGPGDTAVGEAGAGDIPLALRTTDEDGGQP